MKRKRSVDESSDLGERLVKRITGPQRADSRPEATATLESAPRTAQGRTPLQQWKRSTNTTGLQPPSLGVQSSSPLALSLADNYFDTLQTGGHSSLPTQQQLDTLPFLHTTDMWTAPVQPQSTWPTGSLAALPSGGDSSVPDAYMSVYPALPATTMEDLYRPVEQTAGIMSQMPVTTQYQLQMPSNQPMPFSTLQFSPALPDLAPPPFQHHLEQQQELQHPSQRTQSGQHQQYPIDASPFPHLPVSETQATPNLGNNNNNNNNNHLSIIPYQPMPTLQELPTGTPSAQHITNLPILTVGGVAENH
ncbi:hypothetical protein A9Z42_0050480 [Trichoderma parareesei]|uniref:Uncharacterized protein n=1 Tax=Trichoderma parareesei TaxID=858221 RepID=A0A2H2Z9H0_TRIPA|nr:hypothetical protein A9Z42_0050480 [Trichoderma parareesei]